MSRPKPRPEGLYTEAPSVFKLEDVKIGGALNRPEPKRKPRADSIRNREKLLKAASEVFLAGGPEASLEAVARTAGVGIGTLYRHFPTREALFQAVYRHEVDELVEFADRLAQTEAPVAALRTWLRASVQMVATKRGMVAALAPALDSSAEIYVDSGARIRKALAEMMERAVAAGAIRSEVSSEDLLRVMISLCYSGDQPGWQDSVIRLLDVFLDGLVAPPGDSGDDAG